MSSTGTFRGTPKGRPQSTFSDSPSNIPRPPPKFQESQAAEASSSLSASRAKQSKRDEAIRNKIEKDLSKKRTNANRSRQTRKAPPGTVLALRPNQALQINPSTTVTEAAQLMAAKREDCVLVTDDDDRIAGIFTAKDLAFRVVGAGLKANSVTIAEIMTKNPLCAKTDTSATDALDLMVRKGFRHLPVMDENHDISGILDITKCFYDAMEKLERAYSSSKKLYDALEGVQAELGSSQPQQIIQYVEALRSRMSGPTLESVLNGLPPTTVSVRTSVKEAAQQMKENHTTAVLVQDQGQITGIFTSKDVVLRVIAAGLDPATCSVIRVMTPHPDFAPLDMSIQQALRKMHDGHYLNLPVMNKENDEIVGMVDVLKLTYATLDQVNSMSTSDAEGPAWQKFWMSMDQETESMMSGEGGGGSSHAPPTHHTMDARSTSMVSPEHPHRSVDRFDSVAPGDSASHTGAAEGEEPSTAPFLIGSAGGAFEDAPFTFKFKAPSGRVHRVQIAAAATLGEVVSLIAAKFSAGEIESLGGVPAVEGEDELSGGLGGGAVAAGGGGRLANEGFALSYLDNDGDTVAITTDHDLVDAVAISRAGGKDKVDLFVHHPDKPAVVPAVEPLQPPATAPATAGAAMVSPSAAATPPTPPESKSGGTTRRRVAAYEERDGEEADEDEEAAVLPGGSSSTSSRAAATDRRGSARNSTSKTSGATAQQGDQLIPGVQNEIVFGGIAVVGLVVVLAYTLGRSSSR